jgi:hypothetical protein
MGQGGGCPERGVVVDHIVSRGPDAMSNLRHLCWAHDNSVKEDATGKRRSGGKLTVKGCDANGNPLDPASSWSLKG